MKRLCLVRSAKAGWDDPMMGDFEREITGKGRRNTRSIGSFLKLKGIEPDLFLSSCALRAQQTAETLAKALAYEGKILYLNELYQSRTERMREMIAAQEESVKTMVVVGHTPQIQELAQLLGGESIGKFPTSAVACIDLGEIGWEDTLRNGCGRLEFFVYPKQFKYYMPASLRGR